jgi:hypothetical protein
MNLVGDFLEDVFLLLNFFCLQPDAFLSQLQLFDVFDDAVVEVLPCRRFELLIRLILVHVHNLLLNFTLLFYIGLRSLGLFIELVLGDIYQVRNVAGRL